MGAVAWRAGSSDFSLVAVLEIGGTHVSAAVVQAGSWQVLGEPIRHELDSAADAPTLVAGFAAAATALGAPNGSRWGVALPDPFDYAAGIGRFAGQGKFESLDGVDLGAALRDVIEPRPAGIAFVNDADAFALGEWQAGAGRGSSRCAALTLGTGVGSGWLVNGAIVDPGTPPSGRLDRLEVDGARLEELMSRRAIRAAYSARTGDFEADVREIAEHARRGDAQAAEVLGEALHVLGRAAGPCLLAFRADLLVVGGSMAGSWDLFEPWFAAGVHAAGGLTPAVRLAENGDAAGLIGAAVQAWRSGSCGP